MPIYNAPVRDMLFAFYELNDGEYLQQLPGFEDVDSETVLAVLEEAGKFAREQLLPINRNGDEEGCQWNDGRVTTPEGFKEAYAAFIEAGWNSIAFDPVYGGQGLPKSLHLMVDEMLSSTNMSFSLYPGLTYGAWTSLEAYASDEIKDICFPKLAEGVWSGSMCLTEPHCGTDLGLLRTKAEPLDDGGYSITGTKIFITAGDHDLTENIIHLVLARAPDAPEGIKGISLFAVPKMTINGDGTLGEPNNLGCGSIEHKMGLKASSTCVMNFDGARGWLVGEQHKGMRAMFKMMNSERLAVGIQGLGIAEAAYQNAVEYARERLQGRSPRGRKLPDKPADPLTEHPDVRRMLLTMRAYTEGSRALCVRVAQLLDIANKSRDQAERRQAEGLVALLTPVIKAFCSDIGFEMATLGQQIYGGHGYVREHGMEQFVRDARIAQIYEGVNGVQAMDLVERKLPMNDGKLIQLFLSPVQDYVNDKRGDEQLAEFTGPLDVAARHLKSAAVTIMESAIEDPAEPGAAAVDFLRLFGLTALAYEWARAAEIGLRNSVGEEAVYYKAKVRTARFFMQRILPQTGSLLAAISAGSASIMDFDDQAW
ncbi:MAG: acyl-CoA dehydrogenase C-terminal domain-containing protein [Candidatus Thiodiazotropha sp. (ex Cardiolucina cf. quadrata)]|nr:acyl-CoA dehydrogenase C-terminal domain-containing protein [Candidatus Thiodiazotropha sp. (ex Cardiolucina cf. quadrata)]